MLRIGYMERYDGPDTIKGGGSYIRERGVGGEIYNFKPSRGTCYGYAMSLHGAGLDLKFLDRAQVWEQGDELAGVDVVFFARHQSRGQVVVGWYQNSTVYHKEYRTRRGKIPGMDGETRHYLCRANAECVTLLPESLRTFEIPYAPVDGRGFPGQSNVWYPQRLPGTQTNSKVQDLVRRLRAYIGQTTKHQLPADEDGASKLHAGRKRTSDAALNAQVEQAAVKAVKDYYERLGYSVESVERENLGWDLNVTKGAKLFKVEVKGVSASSMYFELTPNEYDMLRKHSNTYRVCVVCCALDKPRVYHFAPKEVDGTGWELRCVDEDALIVLRERTAAIGVEVASTA